MMTWGKQRGAIGGRMTAKVRPEAGAAVWNLPAPDRPLETLDQRRLGGHNFVKASTCNGLEADLRCAP